MQLVPQWSTSHDEADAQHAAATEQNQSENQVDPAYQAEVQRVLDVQHATQKRGIDDAAAERAQAVADWLARKGPNGEPQTSQPPPSLRNRLTPAEQAALDKQLVINARGAVPARAKAAPYSDIVQAGYTPEQAAPPSNAASVAVPAAGAATLGDAAKAAAGAIARAAPYAARAASATGAAAGVLLLPTNSGARYTELGDGLRMRSAPGQNSVTIERRIEGSGIFGTGIDAHWEELPVPARQVDTPDGRLVVAIDPRQLESVLGADAANRIRQQAGITYATNKSMRRFMLWSFAKPRRHLRR